MIDDISFFNQITASNISLLSKRQSGMQEERICELYELAVDAAEFATEMYKSGCGLYEILSLVSQNFTGKNVSLHENAMDENKEKLCSFLTLLDVFDKAFFADFLLSELRRNGINVRESDFLPQNHIRESFTYVKNPLADEAFDVFSQEFNNPTVRYSSSFAEAVNLINSGEAEYCLLPLEERGGARLSTICTLIFKNDLKICSVTPVFGFEGNADMKYAMVSKSFSVPDVQKDDDRYLEIRIPDKSEITISELMSVVYLFGADVYRINSICFETEDGDRNYYSIVLKDQGRDFSSLLIFLTLFSSDYTAVGIYKNLE